MAVKSINSVENNRQKRLGVNQQNKPYTSVNPQFTGSFNPVVTVTDAIARGGFAAEFIAQDGIGMVAPRIWEGLNRGRPRDEETGKKTGPYNWAFARREGIREILSGPSAFLIPAGILAVIKKYSGKANDVSINMINTLSENFVKIADNNKEAIKVITDVKDPAQVKNVKFAFYKQMFGETLSASLKNALKGEELETVSADMANKLINIEQAESKGFFKHFIGKATPGKKEDLTGELIQEFMDLRKKHGAPTSNEIEATFNVKWRDKDVVTSFSKLLDNMTNYTDDVIKSANIYLKNNGEDFTGFLKSFNLRRSGSRLLSNFGMFFAVVGFYDIIPKLYNIGIKANVDEMPSVSDENSAAKKDDDKKAKDVAFKGGMASVNEAVGKKVLKGGMFKKLSDTFEFNGASMSVPAMLTLLFGFCLPPRYRDAKDHHDRREIVVRDMSSFTAILFGAKALSRGFSDGFARMSGLALNTKPDDHSKGFLYKVKNYVTAGSGVNVLSSAEIVTKYSNIDGYKDGINGFFEFLKANGGDPKKVLGMDKTVKEEAEKILGKTLKDSTLEEIEKAFKVAREQEAEPLKKIYKVFADTNNKFVRQAKTMNSAFSFASIILLVPAFMIWLARYCERMTKENKAKERAMMAQDTVQLTQTKEAQQKAQEQIQAIKLSQTVGSKPSMAGFAK
ncbi:hypothetical protein IKU74_00220 [bacterium]|nr:hypothetical protein [bacterium]